MIVVGIIGILGSMSLTGLRGYRARAAAAEAQLILSATFALQQTYYVEKGYYFPYNPASPPWSSDIYSGCIGPNPLGLHQRCSQIRYRLSLHADNSSRFYAFATEALIPALAGTRRVIPTCIPGPVAAFGPAVVDPFITTVFLITSNESRPLNLDTWGIDNSNSMVHWLNPLQTCTSF